MYNKKDGKSWNLTFVFYPHHIKKKESSRLNLRHVCSFYMLINILLSITCSIICHILYRVNVIYHALLIAGLVWEGAEVPVNPGLR